MQSIVLIRLVFEIDEFESNIREMTFVGRETMASPFRSSM
jgi:hypothetical protein